MIRKDVNLSKVINSDILQSVLLMITNKKVPTSFMDFVCGLLLIDNNQEFTKENLRIIFKSKFPRLFTQTTFDNQKFIPFDYFFDKCQSNFYSTTGLIKRVQNNKFQVNNILKQISINTPHKHLFNLRINYIPFEKYKGNMTKLVKDCNWKLIETLINKCKNTIFTYNQIQNIFGLSKTDVKNYLKETKSVINYVYRTIGKNEKQDLELDSNILGFHKNYKIIRGFTIDIGKSLDIQIKVNLSSLNTIKNRLEKHQKCYTVNEFLGVVTHSNCPKLSDSECSFNDQFEQLGFTCVTTPHSQNKLREYVENVNLGSYKQMKNIYSYLENNFHPEIVDYKASFKDVYNKLLKKFVYQF